MGGESWQWSKARLAVEQSRAGSEAKQGGQCASRLQDQDSKDQSLNAVHSSPKISQVFEIEGSLDTPELILITRTSCPSSTKGEGKDRSLGRGRRGWGGTPPRPVCACAAACTAQATRCVGDLNCVTATLTLDVDEPTISLAILATQYATALLPDGNF